MQNKPFTKNMCFQNFRLVLETDYGAQMILNGFLYFCIFKTKSIVLKFLHKLMIKIDINAQQFKYFVLLERKYPSCQT